jgi:hypothetical protein
MKQVVERHHEITLVIVLLDMRHHNDAEGQMETIGHQGWHFFHLMKGTQAP